MVLNFMERVIIACRRQNAQITSMNTVICAQLQEICYSVFSLSHLLSFSLLSFLHTMAALCTLAMLSVKKKKRKGKIRFSTE